MRMTQADALAMIAALSFRHSVEQSRRTPANQRGYSYGYGSGPVRHWPSLSDHSGPRGRSEGRWHRRLEKILSRRPTDATGVPVRAARRIMARLDIRWSSNPRRV